MDTADHATHSPVQNAGITKIVARDALDDFTAECNGLTRDYVPTSATEGERAGTAHSDPRVEQAKEDPTWAPLRAACPLRAVYLSDLTPEVVSAMQIRKRSAGDQLTIDYLAWAVVYRTASAVRKGKEVEEMSGYGRSSHALGVRMLEAVEANAGIIPSTWLGLGPTGVDALLKGPPKKKEKVAKDPGTAALLNWVVPPDSAGITLTENHSPRLDPVAWEKDLLDVDARPELAITGFRAAASIAVSALLRLRDVGEWDKGREEARSLLWDIARLLRDMGGNPAEVDPAEAAEFPDTPKSEEQAREREERRILGTITMNEANAKADDAVRIALDGFERPATSAEVAEAATAHVRSAGGDAVVTEQKVVSALHNRARRWGLDHRRWVPPLVEGLDDDEMARRAVDAGWNPQEDGRKKGKRSRNASQPVAALRAMLVE